MSTIPPRTANSPRRSTMSTRTYAAPTSAWASSSRSMSSPDHQPDRGHVAQTLHLRLQHAADRGHHDPRRGQLVVADQPAQHRQPTADGVGPRAQPFVRQGLPGRVVGDLVLTDQGPAGGGQALRLPVGGGDQQHGPPGAALLGRGRQRRGEQRPHGRRRGQVEGGQRTRPRVTNRLGDGRVGGEEFDESRQGHGWSLSGVQEGSGATLFPSSPIRTNEREPAEPGTTERGARQTSLVTGGASRECRKDRGRHAPPTESPAHRTRLRRQIGWLDNRCRSARALSDHGRASAPQEPDSTYVLRPRAASATVRAVPGRRWSSAAPRS